MPPATLHSLNKLWSCRRAAHFAHFGGDEEEEEEDNLHTGGTEVILTIFSSPLLMANRMLNV